MSQVTEDILHQSGKI